MTVIDEVAQFVRRALTRETGPIRTQFPTQPEAALDTALAEQIHVGARSELADLPPVNPGDGVAPVTIGTQKTVGGERVTGFGGGIDVTVEQAKQAIDDVVQATGQVVDSLTFTTPRSFVVEARSGPTDEFTQIRFSVPLDDTSRSAVQSPQLARLPPDAGLDVEKTSFIEGRTAPPFTNVAAVAGGSALAGGAAAATTGFPPSIAHAQDGRLE